MPRARFRRLALAACWLASMRAEPAAAQPAAAQPAAAQPAAAQPAASATDHDTPAAAIEPPPAEPATPHEPAHDVVLLDPPQQLERAVRAALLPWGMRIQRAVREAPAPTLPGTALHAAVLARELDTKTLVWLSSNADGAALWVYDASKNTIMARPIPDAPLDRALAAALALSVKTWLRSPEQDLEAVAPAVEAPVARAPVAAPAPIAPPPAGGASRDAAPRPSEAARWQIVVHAAARRGAFDQTVFESRYGLEVRMSPGPRALDTRWIWAARIETGGAQGVANAAFQGTYSELRAGASLGVAHRLAEPLSLAFHVGPTVHRGSVWGTLLSDRSAAERDGWGVAAQLRPEVELALGPIGILVQPTLGVSIWGERYEADRQVLLETRPVWWMLGAALRAEIF
jgi:hypothetical protein